MKHEPQQIIRVLKAFKTENATYDLDEVYGVRASLAAQFVSQGLAEIVNVDEDDDEDEEQDPTPIGPAWSDPDLGTFHFDDFGWTTRVPLPGFNVFTRGKRKPPETYKLLIESDAADQLPTPDAVALVKRVLGNDAALARRVADALWADFTGEGPKSGMYWHGDLDQVAEGIETGKPPRKAGDLYKLMSLSEIRIRPVTGDSGKAQVLAELEFDAVFEEEHGVGILTDGANVLGVGYSGEACPFDSD
jgi:hypothetical protein